jgi:hypothetical protein
MIKDITVAKEELKNNGMIVDGTGYQINFTGLIFCFHFVLLNDVQTARVRMGLETHARHSPSLNFVYI